MSDEPLDQVNRAVISITALVVAFAALMLMLLAWGAADSAIGRLEDFTGYLDDHSTDQAKVVVTLGAVVVVLLMLSVLILELTPSPTQKMRARNVRAGEAIITTTEIAARIDDEVRHIEHVADCRAIVAARGKGVDVVLDLQVAAAADLARAADEACRRTHELVEERMSVQLAQLPRARLRYRELRLGEHAATSDAPTHQVTGWERPADEGTHD